MPSVMKKPRVIRIEKVRFFEAQLDDFFRKAGREHLPWRKKRITAYEVWVSEVMLQQTQVARVMGYYTRFLERFPTVDVLVRAEWEDFLPYYQGLGYYARGKNMLKTAVMIVAEYQGEFPRDSMALRQLPGIGPYTAAAIESFAFGKQVVAWDTNVRRVMGRFFTGKKQAEAVRGVEERLSLSAKKLNAALMDLGSSLCGSRPKCGACPLNTRCQYFQEGGKGERGVRKITKGKTVDWTRARTYIVLHANHREYFSLHPTQYQPFLLPKKDSVSRQSIKHWFQEKYGLVVSVRPPRKDTTREILWVNVQILSGEAAFVSYPKSTFQSFEKSLK